MENNITIYPSINIVIPTWNGLYLLKQSLDAIISASKNYPGKSEVTVVDNGSMDRTVDIIIDYYPEIKLIKNKSNIGFGAACNLGVKDHDSDLVLFLNNDIYIESDFINLLVNQTRNLNNFFSICPQTNYWENKELTNKVFSSSINFSFTENQELVQHWAVNNYKNIADNLSLTIYGTGAALLVDGKKFKQLNGFDDIYGLAYWEDVDICVRAWKRGWPSYCSSNIVAWHMISATTKSQKYDTKTILMKRNYFIFQMLHLPTLFTRYKFSIQTIRNGDFNTLYLVQNLFRILKRVALDILFQRPRIDKIIQSIGTVNESWTKSKII